MTSVIDWCRRSKGSILLCGRVESESDDLDNLGHLGHFFGRSSGSHSQTKINYLDVTQISHVL